jgi:thioester reductase-like protein
MSVEILEPRGPSTSRRTVLLTGASGVVGRALLDRLTGMDVICLVHRRPVTGPSVRSVAGDVSQHLLGLDEGTYRRLAASSTPSCTARR